MRLCLSAACMLQAQATLLIPIDAAWQRLSSDWGTSVAELLTNVTALRAVMLYHLLPESLSPSGLRKTPVIHTYWKGHDVYGTFSGNDLMLVRMGCVNVLLRHR